MSTESQTIRMYKYLARGYKITPLSALRRFGCLRAGARMYDLRRRGIPVRTRMVERQGKRFAEYSLA
ncbi:MAG: hypothetical protein KGL39_43080 [Patescibacteria group bacterium]|nr:hypothetical protein [Patescibacteria group bacterium]